MDVVPPHLRQDALRAFDLRERHAAIADLVEVIDLDDTDDPAVDEQLRFRSPDWTVDVLVRQRRRSLILLLHVLPPAETEVQVRHEGPPLEARTTRDGRCELEPVNRGFVSLVVRPTGSPAAVQTAWVRL